MDHWSKSLDISGDLDLYEPAQMSKIEMYNSILSGACASYTAVLGSRLQSHVCPPSAIGSSQQNSSDYLQVILSMSGSQPSLAMAACCSCSSPRKRPRHAEANLHDTKPGHVSQLARLPSIKPGPIALECTAKARLVWKQALRVGGVGDCQWCPCSYEGKSESSHNGP